MWALWCPWRRKKDQEQKRGPQLLSSSVKPSLVLCVPVPPPTCVSRRGRYLVQAYSLKQLAVMYSLLWICWGGWASRRATKMAKVNLYTGSKVQMPNYEAHTNIYYQLICNMITTITNGYYLNTRKPFFIRVFFFQHA